MIGASDLWTASSHSGKVSMPKFLRHVAKLPAVRQEGVWLFRKDRKSAVEIVLVGRQRSPCFAVQCFGNTCRKGGMNGPGERRCITFGLLRTFAMNVISFATLSRKLVVELRNGRGNSPGLLDMFTFLVN